MYDCKHKLDNLTTEMKEGVKPRNLMDLKDEHIIGSSHASYDPEFAPSVQKGVRKGHGKIFLFSEEDGSYKTFFLSGNLCVRLQ